MAGMRSSGRATGASQERRRRPIDGCALHRAADADSDAEDRGLPWRLWRSRLINARPVRHPRHNIRDVCAHRAGVEAVELRNFPQLHHIEGLINPSSIRCVLRSTTRTHLPNARLCFSALRYLAPATFWRQSALQYFAVSITLRLTGLPQRKQRFGSTDVRIFMAAR
jgi:hypothetical protein